MATRRQILIIDSNDYHFEVMRRCLQEGQNRIFISRVTDPESALPLVKSRRYDAILTEVFDHSLRNGVSWLADLKKTSPRAALIVLTTRKDEQKAVAAIKAGADEYWVKDKDILRNLPRNILKA